MKEFRHEPRPTDENYIFAFGATRTDNVTFTSMPSGFTEVRKLSGSSIVSVVLAVGTTPQAVAGSIDPGPFGPSGSNCSAMTFSLRTGIQPGLVRFSGAFATGYSNIPAGGEAVASSTSVAVTMEGGSPLGISIAGGNQSQYRINGGAWTSAAGTIENGDILEVRQTSVANPAPGTSITNTATVSIGSFSIQYALISRRELIVTGASENLTIPTGVSTMSVTGTGGGGGGGGAYTAASSYRGGGGGGGGAMSITPSLSVTAGQVLQITAGSGGTGGLQGISNGTAGGDSSIVRSGTTLWLAKGGSPGNNATSSSNGSGGAGGSGSSGIGTTRYSGGNGGSGAGSTTNNVHFYGGGGGGAGGYTANGGAGANGIASLTRANSSAATGGASSGGGSNSGGGGTGVSGAGTSGAASTSSTGGREGSPDAYATDGSTSGPGGVSGGGGSSAVSTNGASAGGAGVVRITW